MLCWEYSDSVMCYPDEIHSIAVVGPVLVLFLPKFLQGSKLSYSGVPIKLGIHFLVVQAQLLLFAPLMVCSEVIFVIYIKS